MKALKTASGERGVPTKGAQAGIGRISVRSASETAAQALRDAIITGQLKPGERLIEQKLATALGIGQPTLREALKELEYQGFVRKVPQRGTYVTKLTKDDFRKVLEVRMVLELLAIDRAARHMTPEGEGELSSIVEEMGKAARKFDLGAFHKCDVAFHRKVWALAGNEYLEKSLEAVAFRLFAFVLLQRDPESRNEFIASTGQHVRILAGLRSHDPAKARQAFVDSTLKFWKDYHQVSVAEEIQTILSPPGGTTDRLSDGRS